MPVPRIHVDAPLAAGRSLNLPPHGARHVQVLRLQPGAELRLFDGLGGEWQAAVLALTRKDVSVRALAHDGVERELTRHVTLALGMPANERMDGLIEKATELGVAAIQPLVTERSVLRVDGERAERKAAHWRAVAIAACEQCGRNRVPAIAAPLALTAWLHARPDASARLLLSLDPAAPLLLRQVSVASTSLIVLSGPEGGLSPTEVDHAIAAGFAPASLGARTLRADTAPLAALACIANLLPP
ncbi:MAG: 16S rRNA (uracil(1498)-N(3))-methyltransferase [Burkholderiales bacterium]|nr:16S rRNA (uracil(1498)-N(3))-methyltransferase [Burkholderiales bacterium]